MRNGNDALNGISSYALKTVVLLMMKEQLYIEWKEANMSTLFLQVSSWGGFNLSWGRNKCYPSAKGGIGLNPG